MLSGCVLLAGAGAVAGVQTARQERTIGDALDDRAIKTELDAKLRQTSGLTFGIATTVVEGRVLLAGRVDQPEERLAATRVAWTVDGVVKVDNDIEVSEYSGWLDRPQDFIMRQALVAKRLGDGSIRGWSDDECREDQPDDGCAGSAERLGAPEGEVKVMNAVAQERR
jgi:osmotically-inducible protein OsmY